MHERVNMTQKSHPGTIGGSGSKILLANWSYCFNSSVVGKLEDCWYPQPMQHQDKLYHHSLNESEFEPFGHQTAHNKSPLLNCARKQKEYTEKYFPLFGERKYCLFPDIVRRTQ